MHRQYFKGFTDIFSNFQDLIKEHECFLPVREHDMDGDRPIWIVKCHGDKMTCNRLPPKVWILKVFLKSEVIYHSKDWIGDTGRKPGKKFNENIYHC